LYLFQQVILLRDSKVSDKISFHTQVISTNYFCYHVVKLNTVINL